MVHSSNLLQYSLRLRSSCLSFHLIWMIDNQHFCWILIIRLYHFRWLQTNNSNRCILRIIPYSKITLIHYSLFLSYSIQISNDCISRILFLFGNSILYLKALSLNFLKTLIIKSTLSIIVKRIHLVVLFGAILFHPSIAAG